MLATPYITQAAERDKAILKFLPMVRHLVGKLAVNLPSFLDTEDLVEAGTVGLISAVDSFQPGRGAILSTHVYTRVKGAILDELRQASCFSRDFQDKLKRLKKAYQTLEQRLERPPSLDELTETLSCSYEELAELLTAMRSQTIVSLDRHPPSDPDGNEEDNLLAMLASPTASMPETEAEEQEFREQLAEAIATLPERERQVIVLYYYQGLLLQEIAGLLKISPGRVSHLHSRALYQINQYLEAAKNND